MDATEARSDLELIAALNRGDTAAYAPLYYRYRAWVHRLAWRFTQHESDAQDVLQETFLYLARKFPGFTLTASMTTFLYPVVKNTAIAVRKRKRREPTMAPETLPESVDLSTADAGSEDLHVVLAGLNSECREVVLMRFVDGMALEEIATALQIPLGTVKSRLHRALADLRADARVQEYFAPV